MEVNFNNPIYDIGPSLPQECQEPWAALIDTGAVASIVPQAFVPHIPIKEKSETLTSINGGNIKILGVKHVTFITGKIITHVNFLILEGVKNQIIGLDAINSSQSSSCSRKIREKEGAFFNNISAKRFFTIIKATIMHQVWFFQIVFKVIIIFVGQILSSQS